MADDNTIVLKLQLEEAQSKVKIKELNQDLEKLDGRTKEYRLTVAKLNLEEQKLIKTREKLSKSTKELIGDNSKGLTGASKAAGASTSATLELGRVLSDMPYGIRGVANNLQQLASNLFFMSKATDAATGKSVGFGGALKNLLGGLIGPAGILIAFQGVIALFDYFSGGAKGAGESTSELRSELDSLVDTLTNLSVAQSDVNDKILEYIEYRALSAKSDKELKKLTEDLADLDTDISDKKAQNIKDEIKLKKIMKGLTVDEYNSLTEQEKQVKRLEFQNGNLTVMIERYGDRVEDVNTLESERIKIYNKSIGIIAKLKEEKDKLSAAEEDSLKGLKDARSEKEKEREVLSKTSEDYKRLTIVIDEYTEKIKAIEGIKKKAGKSKKLSFFKTPKELDLDVKSNEAALINFQKKIEQSRIKTELNESLSNAKTEEERLKIKKIYDIKLLTAQILSEKKILDLKKKTELEIAKAKTASHVADIKRAFELYKIKIDLDDKLTPEQKERLKADAGGKLFDALKQADIESKKTEKEIEARYEPIYKMFADLKQARFEALFSGYKSKPKDKEETDLEKWARYAENAKAIISSVSDFVDSEFDRQMTIEQNKTNALNNELNKRLLNENLSKEQKEDIQNQIAQNDEKLRVKQEKIARKRFNVMKAFSLATALADTYLATQKAYTSQLQLDPTSPIRAKIAAGVALAAGLANVAAIARTRFESSSGTSPAIGVGGGSGGGSARAEPSFNIVGRSNENILMSAIQSQFDQPLRAYVVARDVTNQQQLDGVITGAAGT